MISGSSRGPVPPPVAALVFSSALIWTIPAVAESLVEPAESVAELASAEATAPAQAPAPTPALSPAPTPAPSPAPTPAPSPAPTPAPSLARTPLSIHASWDDRLIIENHDRSFFLQPIAILQTLFSLPYNTAASSAATSTAKNAPTGRDYEGIGFTFRRAALGFDSRFLGYVRTFFLANIANGTMTLWDFFADLDFFDGKAVLRAGRFRPWLGRQRLLAGDRYQMIQLPVAMTDLLEFGDGRDLGAGIFGLLARKRIEYQIGVWNGEQRYAVDPVNGYLPGTSQFGRGNIDFELGSRLVVHPFGYLPAFDESDLEYSEKPRLSVGAAAILAKRHDVRVPSQYFYYFDDRLLKAGAEIAFRWRGFSFEAEAFLRKAWELELHNPTEESEKHFKDLSLGALAKSGYAQAGMFVMPRLLELTARFDYVDVEPQKPGYIMRPAAGVNLFLHGYNLLFQFMYRANLARGGLKEIKDIASALRPSERTDLNSGYRPIARTTHDFFLMLQTSI